MKEPIVFEMEIMVQPEHLDEMNHVNNVQYLHWVQDVAKAHWEHAANTKWLTDFAWVALSHHIEYKKPAFLGDTLVVRTHVHDFGGVKSHRLVRIVNKATEALVVQASTQWCLIKRDTFKPTRVPNEMIAPFFVSE